MDRINEYDRKYGKHLIGLDEYKCGKCRKVWQPTDKDINKKAMHCYYKCCGVCREYLYNRAHPCFSMRLWDLGCCTEDII